MIQLGTLTEYRPHRRRRADVNQIIVEKEGEGERAGYASEENRES